MLNSRLGRILTTLTATTALALGIVGCGSGDDTNETAPDEGTTTTTATSQDEPDTTTQAPPVDNSSDSDDQAVAAEPDEPPVEEAGDTTVSSETTIPVDETEPDGVDLDEDDTSTEPDDFAASPDELLAQLLPLMGITDIEGAAECFVAEAEQAGITIEQLASGEALIIAAVRCEREAISDTMRASFNDIDTSSIAATPDQIDCTFEATIDYLASLELVGSDSFLSGEAPPELIQALVDTCGVSEADADFLLNDA